MRIVGGKFAGRTLTSPADFRVRPTAEQVRVTMLGLLKDVLPGARVLDLFAGTGALGLEALSRGAATADFVEFRPSSLHALRANVAALWLTRKCRIFTKDAVQFADALAEPRYDIAFVDPPYNSRMLDRVISAWHATQFARVLAVEHAADHVIAPPAFSQRIEDTGIAIYRA
jgi:16S rRNA (guanine966-N2)-methyltransferase